LTVYPYTSSLYDYMSYCGPTWTSDYTYLKIYQYALQHNNLLVQSVTEAEETRYWLVRGRVRSDGSAQLEPLFTLSVRPSAEAAPAAPADDVPTATLELLGNDDQVLAAHTVALRALSKPDAEGNLVRAFNELVPYVEGVAAARLRQGERVLAERRSGSAAPRVLPGLQALASASADTQSLTWRAADEDGDPLSYLVRISTDGGQTWYVAAITDQPTVAFSRTAAPELLTPGQTLVEIQASDGIRTHTQRFAQTGETVFSAVEGTN
ncbi:MAG: hypothetical protein NZ693_05600, partial [Thermoflexales bacterium]|nr:hypothetical protein [Thermoflexales bacterium]